MCVSSKASIRNHQARRRIKNKQGWLRSSCSFCSDYFVASVLLLQLTNTHITVYVLDVHLCFTHAFIVIQHYSALKASLQQQKTSRGDYLFFTGIYRVDNTVHMNTDNLEIIHM